MIGTFYEVPFYICPGQYVYNGMVTSLYKDDTQIVVADYESEFFDYLSCTSGQTEPCTGTSYQYVLYFFGGVYGDNHDIVLNGVVLGAFLTIARIATWVALKYIRYA